MNKARVVTIACALTVVAGALFFYAAPFVDRNGAKGGADQPAGHQGHGQPPAAPPASSEPASKHETPAVEIPVEAQQLIGVRTAVASVIPLSKTIRTVGRIEYDERRLTTVNTKVEGWIEKLHINYTGTYVKRGDRIADIYSPELWATQQEFINLVRWSKKTRQKGAGPAATVKGESPDAAPDLADMLAKDAGVMLEAARRRLELWDISDAQIRKIEQSETPMRTLAINSPVSGYVLQKYAVQGMRVMAGEKLLDISDLSNVWVVADIYEYEFPFVKVGEVARIKLSSIPGKELTSRIEFVSPTLSAQTRTMKVRFTVPNAGGQLRPQMFADVEITVDLGKKLAVPDEAVIDTGLRKIVYIDKGGGHFEPREVATGARAEKMVEIISGLEAGEKVVSSANFLIDSEAKLKGIEPPGATPGTRPGAAAPAGEHRH